MRKESLTRYLCTHFFQQRFWHTSPLRNQAMYVLFQRLHLGKSCYCHLVGEAQHWMSSAWWCAHLLTRTDLLTRPNLLIGGKCHRILLVWPFGRGPNQSFYSSVNSLSQDPSPSCKQISMAWTHLQWKSKDRWFCTCEYPCGCFEEEFIINYVVLCCPVVLVGEWLCCDLTFTKKNPRLYN